MGMPATRMSVSGVLQGLSEIGSQAQAPALPLNTEYVLIGHARGSL